MERETERGEQTRDRAGTAPRSDEGGGPRRCIARSPKRRSFDAHGFEGRRTADRGDQRGRSARPAIFIKSFLFDAALRSPRLLPTTLSDLI